MIHYIKIENFGSIKNLVEMNFEVVDQGPDDGYSVTMPDQKQLLKLAYIYGANASGKTTVLKAFEFLRKLILAPVGDKANLLDFEPFLFNKDPYGHDSRFELSFYLDQIRYIYEVKFNKQSIISEKVVFYQTVKPTELFSRTTDAEKRLTRIEFGSKTKVSSRERDLLESHILHNNTVLGAFTKTNIDIPELDKLNLWFSGFLLGMVNSSNNLTEATAGLVNQNELVKAWIDAFMNKADRQVSGVNVGAEYDMVPMPVDEAFPPNIGLRLGDRYSDFHKKIKTAIKTEPVPKYYGWPNERRIEFIHSFADNHFLLPIYAESSGTKRFFGLGGLLYKLIHESHLLCIDELETSLHPDLMLYYLQAFLLNAKDSQLLITTHNQSLMENIDFLRRDALWFSEKLEDGSSTLYSAAEFDSSVLRKDASIINAYRAGRLGAKPNLGSPFINDVEPNG